MARHKGIITYSSLSLFFHFYIFHLCVSSCEHFYRYQFRCINHLNISPSLLRTFHWTQHFTCLFLHRHYSFHLTCFTCIFSVSHLHYAIGQPCSSNINIFFTCTFPVQHNTSTDTFSTSLPFFLSPVSLSSRFYQPLSQCNNSLNIPSSPLHTSHTTHNSLFIHHHYSFSRNP